MHGQILKYTDVSFTKASATGAPLVCGVSEPIKTTASTNMANKNPKIPWRRFFFQKLTCFSANQEIPRIL
jgi:hypothetical protein